MTDSVSLDSILHEVSLKKERFNYLRNPLYPEQILEATFTWNIPYEALRIVVDIKRKAVYIFPLWVFHSSFIEEELGISYRDLMESTENYFLGSILLHEKGNPYALVDSSQFTYLKKKLKNKEKIKNYIERNLGWLKNYWIEPIKALSID